MKKDLPKEYFFEIENEEFRIGRVLVNENHDGFYAEIDIVQKNGLKIWHHVKRIYHLSDEQDALDQGAYLLSDFLKGPNK